MREIEQYGRIYCITFIIRLHASIRTTYVWATAIPFTCSTRTHIEPDTATTVVVVVYAVRHHLNAFEDIFAIVQTQKYEPPWSMKHELLTTAAHRPQWNDRIEQKKRIYTYFFGRFLCFGFCLLANDLAWNPWKDFVGGDACGRKSREMLLISSDFPYAA